MSIPFTQFLRPNGRRALTSIDRPPGIEKMAHELLQIGCKFEIEELQTGPVSMEVVLNEEPIASRLCANGPLVPQNVDEVVEEGYKTLVLVAATQKP